MSLLINFEYFSWYDDNGCDCCEPTLMEGWNCSDPSIVPHSVYSIEDAKYSVAVGLELVIDNEDMDIPDDIIEKALMDHDVIVNLEKPDSE